LLEDVAEQDACEDSSAIPLASAASTALLWLLCRWLRCSAWATTIGTKLVIQ